MTEFQIEATDRLFADSPEEGDPDCICSRCGDGIPEEAFALRAFVDEGHGGEYRYCEPCQRKAGIVAYQDDDDEPEPDPEGPPKLGKCCACETEDPTVRNFLMLDKRCPEPGGWGCAQCGLPGEGAVAVMCDECMSAKLEPKFACLGYPSENRRIPIAELTEKFEHDMAKHPEEWRRAYGD